MKGAIFYSSRYGSTAQYARWIGEAAELPVLDLDDSRTDPSDYGFVVIASPVIYHKLLAHKWIRRNLISLSNMPVILVSVSGAGAGEKLDRWLTGHLPAEFLSHADHVALRGRQTPADLTLFDRVMLIIGGLANRDRKAGREELKGFDYMDKSSIAPILDKIAVLRRA